MTDVDVGDMLGIVRDSPGQWARALDGALAAPAPAASTPRAVIVAGMGGSGIVADLARLAADLDGRAPVVPVKGYRLPRWAGPDTPVVAVSHSGNTEETLALVDAALAAGAPVHGVTSGGRLAGLADDGRITMTSVPGGMQPRASLPSLAAPALVALERWDVVDGMSAAIEALATDLAPLVAEDEAGAGPARELAKAVQGLVPVIVGGRGVGSLVAQRAATQIAENAEEPAFPAEIPEFDHNALVGFGTPRPGTPFVLVAVADPSDHPRVAARFEPTIERLQAGVAAVERLVLPDGGWLTRLAGGILQVDLLSVHLAIALDRDPTPVDVLVDLKAHLAKTP